MDFFFTDGSTSVSGTLTATGNMALNGTLTQSVSGSPKFSCNTSGKETTAGTLGVTKTPQWTRLSLTTAVHIIAAI